MTNHLEEQVQKLLAGMDDHNEHEVEPGIPGNETTEEIQDIYVLIVREREEEEQAQVVDSTPVKHKPEFMQFIPVCIFLLLLFSTLAFQLYCIFNPPIATITIIPKSQAVSLTGTLQLGRLLQPITISQSQTVPATGKGHQEGKSGDRVDHLVQRPVSTCLHCSRNHPHRSERRTDCDRSGCEYSSREAAQLWTSHRLCTCPGIWYASKYPSV